VQHLGSFYILSILLYSTLSSKVHLLYAILNTSLKLSDNVLTSLLDLARPGLFDSAKKNSIRPVYALARDDSSSSPSSSPF